MRVSDPRCSLLYAQAVLEGGTPQFEARLTDALTLALVLDPRGWSSDAKRRNRHGPAAASIAEHPVDSST